MRNIVLAVLVALGCAALAYSAWSATPSVGDLQRAYEREATIPDGKHDPDLVVVGADCVARNDQRYFCQVGFKRSEENSDRVYLDAALIERREGQWKLLSGLCRRLL